MKKIVSTTMIGAQLALASLAHAHPGPPGHTHPDEWPFDLLYAGLAGLGLLLAWRLIARKG